MTTASRTDDQAELDTPNGAGRMGAEPRSHAVDKSLPTALRLRFAPASRVDSPPLAGSTCPPLPSLCLRKTGERKRQQKDAEERDRSAHGSLEETAPLTPRGEGEATP